MMSVGTAQLLSTTEMLDITNGMGRAWQVLDDYLGAGSGTLTGGYWGQQVLGRIVGNSGTDYGVCDKYKHAQLDSGAQNFADSLLSESFWASVASQLEIGLENNVRSYGSYLSTAITDLDTYATFHNAANDFTMPFNWGFAALYYYVKAKASMLSGANVVGPQVTLARGTVTGTIAMTFATVSLISTVNNPTAGTQGYAADRIELKVTSGTFAGTVTATAVDQGGTSVQFVAVGNASDSTGTAILFTQAASKRTGHVTAANYTGNSSGATFNIRSVSRDLTL